MTPILEVFGPGLLHLKFESVPNIKLADLAICTKLESLRILGQYSSLSMDDNVSTFDARAFLPNLKSFHNEICLGRHSLLFEEKSTLIRLVLSCSHFVMKSDRDDPQQKHPKYSEHVSKLCTF